MLLSSVSLFPWNHTMFPYCLRYSLSCLYWYFLFHVPWHLFLSQMSLSLLPVSLLLSVSFPVQYPDMSFVLQNQELLPLLSWLLLAVRDHHRMWLCWFLLFPCLFSKISPVRQHPAPDNPLPFWSFLQDIHLPSHFVLRLFLHHHNCNCFQFHWHPSFSGSFLYSCQNSWNPVLFWFRLPCGKIPLLFHLHKKAAGILHSDG